MTLVIGIDPGLTGAIAAVDGETLCWVEDMPVANGAVAIALLDQLYVPDEYGPWSLRGFDPEPIAVEHVHSMPKQGVASTFTFGKAYGTILGYFAANGHRITHVAPTEWKSTFRLNGKDKDAARALAIELWPAQAQLFARKKDIGRADAALIALHHSRTTYHSRVQALRDERAALLGGGCGMSANTFTTIDLHNAPRGVGYTFGIWRDWDDSLDRTIFGLGVGDQHTHMVYGSDYTDPAKMLARAKEHGGFWFDAGRDLHCTPEELERCMRAVGLIEGGDAA